MKYLLLTGCDANFYDFMLECLSSLIGHGLDKRADIGILDLGLSAEQVAALKNRGFIVEKATWSGKPPTSFKPYELGFGSRTELPSIFPGYDVYLWFDADAWAQTTEFFDLMIQGATEHGAAVVRENGAGQDRDYLYNRWWYGHMTKCYGPVYGPLVAAKPAVNTGILAISAYAPHWRAWALHYQHMVDRSGRLNMDQHAFNAALELQNLPYAELPARCNWVSTLSTPVWDKAAGMACEPQTGGAPLSVIHLAGPDKTRAYEMKTTDGGVHSQSLTFAACHNKGKAV